MKRNLADMLRMFAEQASAMQRGIEADPVIDVAFVNGMIAVSIESAADPCDMRFNPEMFHWPLDRYHGRVSAIPT